jgi:hypothetical protein
LEVIREGADQRFGFIVGESSHQRVELGASLSITCAPVLREQARGLSLAKRALTP